MPALAIWTPEDGLLAAIAPLGLAAAGGTALVVDLDPHGPRYPGGLTLAGLMREGPRKADLAPRRSGIAVLANGGTEPEEAEEVVAALIAGWPRVVLRLPPRPRPESSPAPLVPVRPLLPGALAPDRDGPAVYQRTGYALPAPGPGPVLPVPARRTVQALLEGALAGPDRWLRAWGAVWRWPWR